MADNRDENSELLTELISTVQKKNDKEKVDDSVKGKQARAIGVDNDTYTVYAYFLDDIEEKEYTFYNKTGEVINVGDTVKVFYTSNPAKGWIGARNGEPNIINMESSASNSSVLTEYKYLTDLSAKMNGITYTAEKDTATGLISKISDSNGNEFEPEISAGITDVALHNAVFWAVVMCRGLGQKIYGNKNIFDISTLKDGVWNNGGNGYSITLPDGTETGADGVCLKSNYHLPITDTLGDYTMFVVAKMSSSMTSNDYVTVVANYGETLQFNLCTYRKCWSIGTGAYSGRHDGVISAADFAVLALRKSGATGVFYINQTQKSSYSGYKTPIKDFLDIGMNFWFKHIAVYPWSMEDSTMLAEISRLMDKYNIGGTT